MLYAVWISFALLAFALLSMSMKSKFFRVTREQRRLKPYIFKKTIKEISFARRLKFDIPCERGMPKKYIEYLGKLYINPKYVPTFTSGIERLLYLYAVMNLYTMRGKGRRDEFSKRQLLKNASVVFVISQIRKRETRIKKIVSQRLYTTNQPLYKIMSGKNLSKIVVKNSCPNFNIILDKKNINLRPIIMSSYINYISDNISVRHYVDKILPVECYEIKSNSEDIKFVFKTNKDKMNFSYSQTSDTFFYISNCKEKAQAILVLSDKKEFGSSLARRSVKELEVYVDIGGNAKIFVLNASCKPELMTLVQKIRDMGGKLDYLLATKEIISNKSLEKIVENSYNSRYLSGENLRAKYLTTTKNIPTLHLPTHIHIIESQQDFFEIGDGFDKFKKLAQLGVSFNIAVIYSSQNDIVKQIIDAFMNTKDARDLIECGVFLFFIDKITVHSDVVYYLCKMYESQNLLAMKPNFPNYPMCSNPKFLASSQSCGNTLSVFINNKSNREQSSEVFVPLHVGRGVHDSLFVTPCVVSRTGAKLKIAPLRNAHAYTIKLPIGCVVYDNFGNIIQDKGGEHMGDRVILKFTTKVKAYGEKVIDIKKENREPKEQILIDPTHNRRPKPLTQVQTG